MRISPRYIRVATVLTIAAATGHVMQNSDAIAARMGMGDAGADAVAAVAMPADTPGPLTAPGEPPIPRIEVEAGLSFIPGVSELRPDLPAPDRLEPPEEHRVAALETASDASPLTPEIRSDIAPAQPMTAADCSPKLTATPAAAAMVQLTLTAPCNPFVEARITHGGVSFKALTDADGAISVAVPALESPARFTATLPGSAEMQTRIEVPELAGYDRIAVTWSGQAALELHAFEFGADYDQAGHVWRGNPGSVDLAAAGRGGFLTLLGNADVAAPVMAEIYTFPAGLATRSGVVRLSLEAEVTAGSCGREIAGHTVTIMGGETPKPVDVTLSVPDCDAIGDFLVLNNLFDTLKIAAK
ncbi:hypothetical protein [Frigidibacter sp. ROC022]|uniref:hypothetical protein n=1 Tax=Frigidibacter sp. ROC022 TaxID=2971796 RepID=UPI00215ADCBA|nr:hypothetical protein [Frigidibacter sp. ROC022]MCR8724426.1 hypothetical protein [Frigidibacter sp. ROC022]